VNEAEHISRLRAFAHWFAMNGGHMTEECKDALTLLADYDALKARLAEAERDFVATCSLHAHVGLEAEVAALRERLAEAERQLTDTAVIAQERCTRLAEAERDAERYQWLRANNKVGGRCCIELECDPPELCTCETGHKPHELDAAIDAARADKGGRHPSTQMTLDRVAAETDAAMRAKFAEADGAGESTRTCKSCGFVAKSDGWLNCPRCTAAATPPAGVKP